MPDVRARLAVLMVAAALSAPGAGCGGNGAGPTPVPTPVYDRATLAARYDAIAQIVGVPACTTTPQCAAIPVGAKPCGGPWRYLVYSKANVNETELQRRAADLFAFEMEYNKRNGVASDCSLARTATPACVEGSCVDLNAR